TGQNRANPTGTILSAALLLRYSLGLEEQASAIEQAVNQTIEAGIRTPDIAGDQITPVGTSEFGDAVAERIGVGVTIG
ncbi:MAG TPA: isocitrate/isopropylmalate family dehydrogenase, partial [Thermomicrobiales bacterium]|nr:isocitrate/isopropylmalate family dehydrogenase [Thermomicrobiales bacterium]